MPLRAMQFRILLPDINIGMTEFQTVHFGSNYNISDLSPGQEM
jgi:hypothetical protein